MLLSGGRAQPSRRRDGEDSVSALVTDISKSAGSFSCVMRPGFLVNSISKIKLNFLLITKMEIAFSDFEHP